MARWALFAAHRYVWAGAAVPRTVGPDGRPLQRGWRQRSERAAAEAQRIRAARPQSVWPKVLGWVCIGVALWGVLMPVGSMPTAVEASRHVALSTGGRPAPEPRGPAIAISSLRRLPDGEGFGWRAGEVAGPFTFVLLGEDYRRIAVVDGIEAAPWPP